MAGLPSVPEPHPAAARRRLWLAYAGLCLLCWLLYAMAATEWPRGRLRFWQSLYEATLNLGVPMLLGAAALPWVRWLQRRERAALVRAGWHLAGALCFVAAWQAADTALAWWSYGADHARASFEQRVLWLAVWGVFVYGALVLGFGGALHARRAQAAALQAARAEAALVRAELAAISGKLNPHFLFNTLNALVALTRKDSAQAEQALLTFARMMRYVLDTRRGAAERVPLRDELEFVRDYLALEALRLGPRLRVEWRIDPLTEADEVPPLTLQPLVENSIVHGIAPRAAGGTVQIEAARQAGGRALALQVADDGAGCAWPPPAPRHGARGGVGLAALRRRFELDFGGAARMDVRSAPGAGFQVRIVIPQPDPA
jgi:hypothetical protein